MFELLHSSKIKQMKKLLFFLFIAAGQLVNAQNYTVGTQTITYTDPGRSNRSVGVDFRYPGTNSAVAAGQFPFVIFAHGFSMDQTPYYPYADSLVKHGYIVGLLTTETGLSPSHPNFAQDLIFVYNKLISEGASNSASVFYQKVIAKGALGGHSMGGGSTVLSAQYGNPQECSFTFAAATTNPSSITAAKFMTKPYLSFGGSLDCIAPVNTNQTPMYDSSGSACKFLVNVTGGLHCQYGNANSACSFGEGFSGCASSSLTRQQQIDKTLLFLIPFLDYYLKGDCAAWTRFESVYSSNTVDVLRRNCTNTVPSNPSITGATSFCSGGSVTLTANPAGFTYTWNNSVSTQTNSINSPGNYSVVVGNGVCSLAAVSVSVTQNQPPASTGAITANDTVCSGISSINISVAPTALATSYQWTLPAGWSISGSDSSATIVAASGGAGGTISVSAVNSCGVASASVKQVAVVASNLGSAGAITGLSSVCPGQSTSFSINPVSGADSYVWNAPADWAIQATADSNYIEFTAGQTSGSISVSAVNSCGQGLPASQVVTVNNPPSVSGNITGPDTLCAGQSSAYYVGAANGATNYQWTLPSGWNITSLADSNYVEVSTSQTAGQVSVAAVNQCGTGASVALNVAISTAPVLSGEIAGQDTVCQGMGSGMYFTLSSLPVGDFNYNWSIPADWSFVGNANSSAPIVNANSSGAVQVYLSNACGNSSSLSLNVTVVDTPTAQITVSGTTLQASPIGSGYTYTWYFNGQPVSGETNATYTPAQSGNYTVAVSNESFCSSLSAQTAFVYNSIKGIEESKFTIYPNPNPGTTLYFNVPQNLVGGQYKIIDATGKMVKQGNLETTSMQLAVSGLSKGLYLLTVAKSETSLSKDFAIE